MKSFTCAGCGKRVRVNEGNPRQRPFIWRDAKTNKPRAYCYECDDKLIQDVPLPRHKGELWDTQQWNT